MRQRRLRQIEIRKDIRAERPFELFRRDFVEAVLSMLLGGSIHQDIKLP